MKVSHFNANLLSLSRTYKHSLPNAFCLDEESLVVEPEADDATDS